jgi:hypothetical protein
MSDLVRVRFQFGIGQPVRWADDPEHPYVVVWRRYHEGQATRHCAYGLTSRRSTGVHPPLVHLAYEADLEEDTKP